MMVETSLDEIFSGDIPRIDTVRISPGRGSSVSREALKFGVYVVGDARLVLNESREQFQRGIEDEDVFLVRTPAGFKVEYGVLPPSFRGAFTLPERVTFKAEDLLLDDRISRQVSEIKEFQTKLDSGIVGTWRYMNTGNLWARVRGLNEMIAAQNQRENNCTYGV
jgi:hypothetical protein